MESNIPIPGQLYTNGDRVFEISSYYAVAKTGEITVRVIDVYDRSFRIWPIRRVANKLQKLTGKETAFFLLKVEHYESNKVL